MSVYHACFFFHTLQATPWWSFVHLQLRFVWSLLWILRGAWACSVPLQAGEGAMEIVEENQGKSHWEKTKKKHINSKCMNLPSYRILKHEIFIYHFCSRWITNRFHGIPLFLFLQILFKCTQQLNWSSHPLLKFHQDLASGLLDLCASLRPKLV